MQNTKMQGSRNKLNKEQDIGNKWKDLQAVLDVAAAVAGITKHTNPSNVPDAILKDIDPQQSLHWLMVAPTIRKLQKIKHHQGSIQGMKKWCLTSHWAAQQQHQQNVRERAKGQGIQISNAQVYWREV